MDLNLKKVDNLDSKKWYEYLNIIGNYTIFHTPELISYFEKTSEDVQNQSFFCFEKKVPIAFVPLAITGNIEKKISFGSNPCHLPIYNKTLYPRTQRILMESIYKYIFSIMKEKKIKYIDFFYHPVFLNYYSSNEKKVTINYKDAFSIMKYFDLKIATINTNIIDLSADIDNLEKKLQRQLRNELKRDFFSSVKFTAVNMNNSSKENIKKYLEIYKQIHLQAVGRKTRPDSSWEKMLDCLLNSTSSLFFLEFDNRVISGLWCTELFKFASSGSQASIKDDLYKKYSLRSYLEWEAIKYYKQNKFNYYELGQSHYFDQEMHNANDEKHKRIGALKTRFGGDLYPRHYFRILNNCKNIYEDSQI